MSRKPVFDTVRQILGRGFRQREVTALDSALDQTQNGAENLPQGSGPSGPCLSISERGIALIKQFEGCARLRRDGLVEAYPDPGSGGDPWTIGWGATGKGIGPGTVWTRAQCDTRLERDLQRYADDVVAALNGAATSQNQFDALVSFHYNTGAIRRSTLTRKHRAGDFTGAVREFARWNKAAGRVMKGLTRRRSAEARLYAAST